MGLVGEVSSAKKNAAFRPQILLSYLQVGAEGPRGKDGRCNCSFPDLYVQRIAVPGPPIIKASVAVYAICCA